MEALIAKLLADYGDIGVVIAVASLMVGYLYRRVEALQKENVDTLKLVLPLMEKFQVSMESSLRAVSRKGSEE